MNENIDMFNDFMENIDVLESEFVEEFISFKDFFVFDNEFLLEIYKVKDVFNTKNQVILKE
jgi:hypothetical protein